MSNENHLFPSRFEVTPESVATAIEIAKRSTPELKWGPCKLEVIDHEKILSRGEGNEVWMAWCGPADSSLIAALTGNGPTSEANALFFAHARDIVIALGEEWQRLKAIEAIAVKLAAYGHFERDHGEPPEDPRELESLKTQVRVLLGSVDVDDILEVGATACASGGAK